MRKSLRKQKRLRGIRFKANNLNKLSKSDLNFWNKHMKPKSTEKVYAADDTDSFLEDAINEI